MMCLYINAHNKQQLYIIVFILHKRSLVLHESKANYNVVLEFNYSLQFS